MQKPDMLLQEDILIDAPFIPDPDADEELGPNDSEAIADQDVEGSRLLLVRRSIEALDLEGTPGGVIHLACTFHPAHGTRFTFAQLQLRLGTPQGIRIIDLAPRDITDANPVEFTLNSKGQIGLKNLPVGIEPSIEVGKSKTYTTYFCHVQGSGEGTNLARWDFRENPHRQDGISPEQLLALTVPVTGEILGLAIVHARLARPGLGGKLAAIRDMILPYSSQERFYPVTFNIPEIPSPKKLSLFFRFV